MGGNGVLGIRKEKRGEMISRLGKVTAWMRFEKRYWGGVRTRFYTERRVGFSALNKRRKKGRE